MAATISPLASVHPDAQIADEVTIGPFCVISSRAKIGFGTVLENNVTLMGDVTLGERNQISPNAVLGGEPQDISYGGTETKVVIGSHNIIREGVTINRASEKEELVTRVGDGCFLMAYSHVAHDCHLEDNIIIANNVLLGGHVHLERNVIVSGSCAAHHFATVGKYSFIGGLSAIRVDVPPYMLADGNPAKPYRANLIGLRRAGMDRRTIQSISLMHKLYYVKKVQLEEAIKIVESEDLLTPEVEDIVQFLEFQASGANGRGSEGRRARKTQERKDVA